MEKNTASTESRSESESHPLRVLRFRDFRLFWFGLIFQVCGLMMFQFTLGWLAFEITGSPAKLAFIHLCGFAPQIVLTLLGGVLADRWNPRKLIGYAQGIGAVTMFALGMLALLGQAEFWHLALASFLIGVSNSIDEPARSVFFPRLLPDRSHLRAAIPLVSMAWGGTRIIAPSIAGFVIAASGADISFLLSGLGLALMVAVICVVRAGPGGAPSQGSMLANFTASVRYVAGEEVFSKVIFAALLNASLAMGYMYMLPVFAKDVLAVDARGLGILTSAAGVGSLCGLLTYAWLQARVTPRNILVGAVTALNFSLIGFAWSDSFWLCSALLVVTGLGHAWFMTGTQVILQTLVEDAYRGRVMALFSLVWSMMVLSGFLLNLSADFIGPRWALTGGTTIVLAYVWLSLVRSAPLRKATLGGRKTDSA